MGLAGTLKVKDMDFYTVTLAEIISGQYCFVVWQAAGKNDAWSSAHCGLRYVNPVASSFELV
jgi:hypothetical protein